MLHSVKKLRSTVESGELFDPLLLLTWPQTTHRRGWEAAGLGGCQRRPAAPELTAALIREVKMQRNQDNYATVI